MDDPIDVITANRQMKRCRKCESVKTCSIITMVRGMGTTGTEQWNILANFCESHDRHVPTGQ